MFTIHVHVTGPVRVDIHPELLQQVLDSQKLILKGIGELKAQGAGIMARQDVSNALLAQIDEATTNLANDVAKVSANETAQLALIQQLRDQVAGNTEAEVVLTQLENGLQARVATLQGIEANLRPLATDPSNPVPEPTPVPPVEEGGGGAEETGGGTGGTETGEGGGTPEIP